MKPSTLFISYDGLLDPLGPSQILPYLTGIAQHPRKVYILSFEKPDKFKKAGLKLQQELETIGILWQPIMFSSRFSYLSKAWDLLKMYTITVFMLVKYPIKIIHARGHAPAQVGLFWKRFFPCKLLFDFRGLWVDERVDKGGWNRDSLIYRYFKNREKVLLENSEHMVVLTKAVIPELKRLGLQDVSNVTVIPCCSDFKHFRVLEAKEKLQQRKKLNVPEDAYVLGYLGSVGKMYMMDEFFNFFQKTPHSYALILTPDVNLAHNEMQKYLSPELHERVFIRTATREEMPELIGVMDVMLSFIKPGYARLATSPTKIAECLACGVPVISNSGIGDVSEILHHLKVGQIIDDFSQPILLQSMDAWEIRNKAIEVFSLSRAHQSYYDVYEKLSKEKTCSML